MRFLLLSFLLLTAACGKSSEPEASPEVFSCQYEKDEQIRFCSPFNKGSCRMVEVEAYSCGSNYGKICKATYWKASGSPYNNDCGETFSWERE